MIYLDNAATTLPKPKNVGERMIKALAECGNAGRGGHHAAGKSADILFECREKICRLFGQDNPEQVVFTQNTTHALNLAIKGMLQDGGHCVISGYEHNSVVRPLYAMQKQGVTYTAIQTPLFEPELFLRAFEKAITPKTVCAVCTHISNVFGYVLPVLEVDRICSQYGIPLIIDAAQSAGSYPISKMSFKAAVAICAPGHKGLYGPQGTGFLACREGFRSKSILEGGTGSRSSHLEQPEFLPDQLESGTQNVHGIAGLCAGIDYVLERGETEILKHEQELITYAAEELQKNRRFRVFAGDEQGGVLAFVDDTVDAETITEYLGVYEIAVRGGLHCAPLAHQTAGTRDGCVRISVSDFNSFDDINRLCERLKKL